MKMEMLTGSFGVCQCHQTFEQFRFLALLSGGCFETLHLTFLTCVAKLDKVEQLRKLSKKKEELLTGQFWSDSKCSSDHCLHYQSYYIRAVFCILLYEFGL